jgi:hypothetical protein
MLTSPLSLLLGMAHGVALAAYGYSLASVVVLAATFLGGFYGTVRSR